MAHLLLDNKLANAPALGLLPNFDEPPVQPTLGHQLLMGAPLNDAAVIHHQDLIGVLDGSQTMGDGENGLPPCQGCERLLDQMLILRVYAGGGLVQDHNGSVLQNGPGDGNTLLLSAG